MTMRIRKDSTVERRAELMTEWYREQLKEYIGPLVERWAEKLEERDVTWQIKSMKTLWGSCNARRRSLLFNLELARVPKECIEYVVVHELTHLKIQNHSKVFEFLLGQQIPNWKSLRKKLNEYVAMPI